MADTIDSITLSNEWQSVDVLTGGLVVAGSATDIQFQQGFAVQLAISSTQPLPSFRGWILGKDPTRPLYISAGENTIWLKGPGIVSIQEG